MMRTSLGVALLASTVTVCSAGTASAATSELPASGQLPAVSASVPMASVPMAPERVLQVSLVLKPRTDAAAQHAAIEQWLMRDAADPLLRGPLDKSAAAATGNIAQVKDYLRRYGITDVQVVSDGRVLQASGTAAALQAAFAVTLRTASVDGRAVYFNQSAIVLPAALRPIVQGVVGLDNLRVARSPQRPPLHTDAHLADRMLRTSALAAPAAAASEVVQHSVEELNSAYGASALAPASSVVGAVIAVGNLQTTLLRLQHFQTVHGLQTPVTVVTVGDPAAPGYRSVNDEIEWDMDTQLLLGSAGGLKRLIIYNVPDFTFKSLIDGMTRASDDNLARVVSMSIGAAETDINAAVFEAMDASLAKAVRQGQNFLISSGDDGIYQPLSARANAPYYDSLAGRPQQRQVAFPASDPYAIAVGATELQTKVGSPGSYVAERVWNAGVGGQITQGGMSRLGAAPQWQKTLIAGQVNSGRRAVPDVSFNGAFSSSAQILGTDAQGNEEIWHVLGTSASAPTFAGYVARLLQSHPNLGFIGPQIYRYASQRNDARRKHDVLAGTNGLYGDGYVAASGWDFASGWGSLDIADFDRFLAHASP
ncbi:protease [Xanthomonas sp. Leaf131]|nr:protease [Xanthomonas sp. Leaf131]